MRNLTRILIVIAVAAAGIWLTNMTSVAKDMDPMIRKKAPIAIEGGTSSLLTVTFEHSAHRGIACLLCHHDTSTDIEYSTCRSEACHATPGARERNPESMFMAFHARDMERSCYGCHAMRAEASPLRYPGFKNCQPCHSGPETAMK